MEVKIYVMMEMGMEMWERKQQLVPSSQGQQLCLRKAAEARDSGRKQAGKKPYTTRRTAAEEVLHSQFHIYMRNVGEMYCFLGKHVQFDSE